MGNDFEDARLAITEVSMLKNSTFGIDSGFASSNEVSQSSISGTEIPARCLSAISSIHGGLPHVGEFMICI